MRIVLPPRINADGLLPFLALLGQRFGEQEEVSLDFTPLRRVTPAGLVALVAAVIRWRKANRTVVFEGTEQCSIANYL